MALPATLSNGKATISLSGLDVRMHTIFAEYPGNDPNDGSSNSNLFRLDLAAAVTCAGSRRRELGPVDRIHRIG